MEFYFKTTDNSIVFKRTEYSKIKYYKNDKEIDECEDATLKNIKNALINNQYDIFKYNYKMLEFESDYDFNDDNISFENSHFLESVKLHNILKIEPNMFYCCYNLKHVELSNQVIQIGKSAFEDCEQLQSIIIPLLVQNIPDSCFKECIRLEEVILPDDLISISFQAFSKCNSLKKILIPDKVEKIPEYCFYYCSSLEDVILPSNLKIIENRAFSLCNGLHNIYLPNNIERINDYAFYGSGIEKINLPDSLEHIGIGTFFSTKIKSIKLPPKLKVLATSVFNKCDELEHIEFNEGLNTISALSFADCKKLKSITLPSSITNIDIQAFEYTNLEEIIFTDDLYKTKPGLKKFIEKYKDIIKVKSLDCILEENIKKDTKSFSIKLDTISHLKNGFCRFF